MRFHGPQGPHCGTKVHADLKLCRILTDAGWLVGWQAVRHGVPELYFIFLLRKRWNLGSRIAGKCQRLCLTRPIFLAETNGCMGFSIPFQASWIFLWFSSIPEHTCRSRAPRVHVNNLYVSRIYSVDHMTYKALLKLARGGACFSLQIYCPGCTAPYWRNLAVPLKVYWKSNANSFFS